jgi:two-component system sensor histidine kinase CpxA
VVRGGDPTRYWGAVPVLVGESPGKPPTRARLIAVSDRRDGHGLFFDARPWLIAGTAVLIVSTLVWVPLVRSLTSPIVRMTSITERIATGRFDVRLGINRTDEIGRLASAINDMAARLGRFVGGQKRFLADVAHELSSPIARLELALGILEHGSPCSGQLIEDIREDVQHMAELVQELLLYVRAEQDPSKATLESTALRPVVERALHRECRDGVDVRIEVSEDAVAMANPPLLTRALANLLRNAVRYAGDGPITVAGARQGDRVRLEVRDEGPGVPDESLNQIFDPFYRPDDSRVAERGGVGLGLAIVRTCVEASRGRVSARNLRPHGLSVVIELDAAPEEDLT